MSFIKVEKDNAVFHKLLTETDSIAYANMLILKDFGDSVVFSDEQTFILVVRVLEREAEIYIYCNTDKPNIEDIISILTDVLSDVERRFRIMTTEAVFKQITQVLNLNMSEIPEYHYAFLKDSEKILVPGKLIYITNDNIIKYESAIYHLIGDYLEDVTVRTAFEYMVLHRLAGEHFFPERSFVLYENEEGKITSLACRADKVSMNMSDILIVTTLKQYRNKGYAKYLLAGIAQEYINRNDAVSLTLRANQVNLGNMVTDAGFEKLNDYYSYYSNGMMKI